MSLEQSRHNGNLESGHQLASVEICTIPLYTNKKEGGESGEGAKACYNHKWHSTHI